MVDYTYPVEALESTGTTELRETVKELADHFSDGIDGVLNELDEAVAAAAAADQQERPGTPAGSAHVRLERIRGRIQESLPELQAVTQRVSDGLLPGPPQQPEAGTKTTTTATCLSGNMDFYLTADAATSSSTSSTSSSTSSRAGGGGGSRCGDDGDDEDADGEDADDDIDVPDGAGVVFSSSSLAFSAAAGVHGVDADGVVDDEDSDDGEDGSGDGLDSGDHDDSSDVDSDDDGSCSSGDDGSTARGHEDATEAPHPTWTPALLSNEPLLLHTIRSAVALRLTVELRRRSLPARVNVVDVHIQKIRRVVVFGGRSVLRVYFFICRQPRPVLDTFGLDVVVEGDKLQAALSKHHSKLNMDRDEDLRRDHADARQRHRHWMETEGQVDDNRVGDDGTAEGGSTAVGAELARQRVEELLADVATMEPAELNEHCAEFDVPTRGISVDERRQRLQAALQEELTTGNSDEDSDVGGMDPEGVEVDTFGANAYHERRRRTDGRRQLDIDMEAIEQHQARQRQQLEADFKRRCSLFGLQCRLRIGLSSMAAPARRMMLSETWLNQQNRLQQLVGTPGPFAQTCILLQSLFPDHVQSDCQLSFDGCLLSELDKCLLTKMWLRTGDTIGMMSTYHGIPVAVVAAAIRQWVRVFERTGVACSCGILPGRFTHSRV
jgi:hypothetical protein